MIDIIITTWNLPDYLKLCIESIKLHTKDYRIIVVNNGQDRETIKKIDKFESISFDFGEKNLIVINNPENLGYCKAINQGVNAATSEYVALVTNDIIVTPDWLEKMLQVFKDQKNVGLVGAIETHASGIQDLATIGYLKEPLKSDRIILGCALFHRETFLKMGGMDEKFPNLGGNYSDDDLSRRYFLKGFNNYIAPVIVFHFPSMSYKSGLANQLEDLRIGKKYFLEKWKKK